MVHVTILVMVVISVPRGASVGAETLASRGGRWPPEPGRATIGGSSREEAPLQNVGWSLVLTGAEHPLESI